MKREGNKKRVYTDDQKRNMINRNLEMIAHRVKNMKGDELNKTLSSFQAISGLGPSTPVPDQSEDIIQINKTL